MINKIKQHTISFKYAFEGLFWALKTQPNYQIHFLLSLFSLIGAFYFEIGYEEFLVILVLITIGFVIETLNTSIEATCDAISLEKHPTIKLAKDAAAAAMLIFALGSFIIACIIFIPKF